MMAQAQEQRKHPEKGDAMVLAEELKDAKRLAPARLLEQAFTPGLCSRDNLILSRQYG